MGLFDKLVQYQGQIKSVEDHLQAASSDPVVLGVKKAIELLPDGGLKDWLSANPKTFWNKILQLFTGKKYTSGEYRVGERYLDQVLDNGNPDTAVRYGNVPDDVVEEAKQFMTFAFGVRITTQEDLNALEQGVAAYQARPEKADIPLAAIQRAVMLKQTYYPDSTYNTVKWDLDHFDEHPLVAPIPGLAPNTLYTGELPGGAMANNGVIVGDGFLNQVLNHPGTPGTPAAAGEGVSPIVWIAAAGLALFLFMRKSKRR